MSQSSETDVNPTNHDSSKNLIVTAENHRRSSSTDRVDLVAPAHDRTLAFDHSPAGVVVEADISGGPAVFHYIYIVFDAFSFRLRFHLLRVFIHREPGI
jgi:hypothetical protein